MLRRSLLSTTTSVLLLLLAPTMTGWAGSHNITLVHPITANGSFGLGGSSAAGNPSSVSTALSTALSVGGTTDTINTNLLGNAGPDGKKVPVVEFNSAPTVQTAVGAAVSIGGNASAAAINTNDVSQIGQR